MLFEKPIDLRHICLFYIGHIPAFLDIHLSNLLGEPNTEPEYFKVRLVLYFPCDILTYDSVFSNVVLTRMRTTPQSVTM